MADKTDILDAFFESGAATYLRRSQRTLQHWRHTGSGPRFVKVGRRVMYLRRDLDAFVEASAVNPSTDHPTAPDHRPAA